MQTKLLTIFTRTPLHVGAGSSVGAVDQPVIRERHTRFPVIPGTSLKGTLADLWNEENGPDKDGNMTYKRSKEGVRLFGNDVKASDACAGKLLIGEGKLLAFPVRSAKGCFAWITCPLILDRFARDAGYGDMKIPSPKAEQVFIVNEGSIILADGAKVILEEYPLSVDPGLDPGIPEKLAGLCGDAAWKKLAKRFAVVSDELFAYFAENACEIANHNRIDDGTGVVAGGALFNQENVPSETLFYSVFHCTESGGDFNTLAGKLAAEGNLLQIGADMTTGLGWCSVALTDTAK